MSAFNITVVRRNIARERGFSLVEVSIVTAIMLLLAIISIPAIGGYIIENKVPKVGEELARFIVQSKVNALNGSTTPYLDMDTGRFASFVRGSSVFSVSGSESSARVLHGMGSNGEVTIEPAQSGEAFAITLTRVNNAACPSIASVMQRVSESITISAGSEAATVVKDATTPYSALSAESHCAQGDVNTFVFVAS
ncbi:MAG: prepilin-type N-terminal cleavage/methylation domain-containing protein [Burkholderiaceae bacterium]|nr:MAG: prepilin-type N-terminal cleavage/methylation domain-containing protein [Burkholderiaceae bacterium]TAM02262.1 MAG: prepilin-type N-terminal cleavage/methylation domain-containing protein [Pusillimonas sp.]